MPNGEESRGPTGRYTTISRSQEEIVRAFIPAALPPSPPITYDTKLIELLNQAHLAIGRLDSVTMLIADPSIFLYSYVRKEAVLSSQIEGTQSSLSDLLRFEADGAPGVPVNDVQEVSTYAAATNLGVQRLTEGVPLSTRLIRELHAQLLASGRGSRSDQGNFRRSQVWLGGSRPGNAAYVPPPPEEVASCMSDLEKWLHGYPEQTPTLVKAALAHVQFESIHPFLDGNGRMGRLLISLILCAEGVLRDPVLYLSLYLKQNRARYYELLTRVRTEGAWEEWLRFFAQGVVETANNAATSAQRLAALIESHRRSIQGLGRTAGSALRVHHALLQKPVASSAMLMSLTGLPAPTVNRMLEVLEKAGIVQELTGRQRNRLFSYAPYVAILNEDTEPLAS